MVIFVFWGSAPRILTIDWECHSRREVAGGRRLVTGGRRLVAGGRRLVSRSAQEKTPFSAWNRLGAPSEQNLGQFSAQSASGAPSEQRKFDNEKQKYMKKKVIIFSAPSGAGKSTIVRHLLTRFNCLEFSVSATSRAPRGQEQHGKDYYFFSTEEFETKISNGEFVEYEEVYKGSYYGTLKSEVERIWAKGNIIIFDIDVKGGVNLKKLYGENALAVFIQPPSVEELRNRLVGRGTDSPEAIERRVAKAEEELTYADKFDVVLVNDNLEEALGRAEKMVADFQAK